MSRKAIILFIVAFTLLQVYCYRQKFAPLIGEILKLRGQQVREDITVYFINNLKKLSPYMVIGHEFIACPEKNVSNITNLTQVWCLLQAACLI